MATGPFNQCLFHRAEKSEHMIDAAIDGVLVNHKVIKTHRSPELSRLLSQSTFVDNDFRIWQDHVIAIIEHDRFGERHRASVLLLTNHSRSVIPMYEGPVESLISNAVPIIFTAPVSDYERDDYEFAHSLVISSTLIGQEWQARMNKMHRNIAEDNFRTSEKIHEINREASSYIASLRESTNATVQASNERNHQRTLEMLTDTQTVQASDGPVRVPTGIVWQTDDGSMYISQNPTFDPNELGVRAKKLPQVR